MAKLARNSSKKEPSKALVKQLQEEFLSMDSDGDGKISTKEVGDVLRSMRVKLKLSDADIKRALKEMDKDQNGVIELKEYFMYMNNKTSRDLVCRALFQRTKLRKEFQRFDKDGSGFISEEELMQVVRGRTGIELSHHQITEMLQDSDPNDDGKIDYEEFVVFMTR